MLFDTQKKIKSSHLLSLQFVAVSWINIHNRIEKVGELPFLYSVPKIVRMQQKLAFFEGPFWWATGGYLWNQKFPQFSVNEVY